jgi:hypothetical protein
MAPKVNTMDALQRLADQETHGLLTERGEFVMDEAMHQVIQALTAELGGLGARSKVVRRLIQKGARVELQERQAKERGTVEGAAVDPVEAAKEEERAKRRERDRRRREAREALAAQAAKA